MYVCVNYVFFFKFQLFAYTIFFFFWKVLFFNIELNALNVKKIFFFQNLHYVCGVYLFSFPFFFFIFRYWELICIVCMYIEQ